MNLGKENGGEGVDHGSNNCTKGWQYLECVDIALWMPSTNKLVHGLYMHSMMRQYIGMGGFIQ